MKAELQKFLKLFEELEEAGETASLTLVTKGGKTTIKLQLESSPSLPSTTTSTTTQPLPPAPGKRRRHRLTDWEHGPPLKITDHDFKNFFKFW